MSRLSRSILTVLVFGALAMPAAVSVQQPDEDGRATPAKDWPLVGGDWGNTRSNRVTMNLSLYDHEHHSR